MIVWLNGTFGAGKTTTAQALDAAMPTARLFDPEMVGFLVRAVLRDHDFADFQDLPPWRALVPAVMSEITRFTGQDLIAAQSVLDRTYWNEIRHGLSRYSLDVFHVVLHADPDSLTRRIHADRQEPGARQWRLEHIPGYLAARPWMESAADLVIDTTDLPAAEAATVIHKAIQVHG